MKVLTSVLTLVGESFSSIALLVIRGTPFAVPVFLFLLDTDADTDVVLDDITVPVFIPIPIPIPVIAPDIDGLVSSLLLLLAPPTRTRDEEEEEEEEEKEEEVALEVEIGTPETPPENDSYNS